jgi:hypothetical protein
VPAAEGGVRVSPALAFVATLPRDDEPRGEELLAKLEGRRPVRRRGAARPWVAPRLAVNEPNARANDTAFDSLDTCNSETSIAAWGDYLVAGWNDGLIFPDSPGASGYGYSIDGGRTWTDGGLLPATAPALTSGDPALAADHQGNFYYASLYSPDGDRSSLSVHRGRFENDSLVWGPPVMPVIPTPSDFLDKEWLAVDPESGYVYLSWTRFDPAGGSRIEFVRSYDRGATWSPRLQLTSSSVAGVQGTRIVIGPDHEVYVIYYAYDYLRQRVFMRTRRSLDRGRTFGLEVTLPAGRDGVITNYGSGPPGFNRPRGIGLPSLAVDRSQGPNRGRLYAVWEETVDYLPDRLGTLGTAPEVEPNGVPDSATAMVIGETATGELTAVPDRDWFRFQGNAGQTVVLYLSQADSATGLGEIRLHCESGSDSGKVMHSDLGLGYGLIVYTLPVTGEYRFRIAVSNYLGRYQVFTGWHTPGDRDLARDTRDVILQSSADGVTWDPPRRVNVDAPGSDDAFPEVAVDGSGRVWIAWFGHRVDACRVLTDIFATRSVDGGASFAPEFQVNDGPPVNWNLVATDLRPNMGDYMTLVAQGCRVYANFSDGRQGTPDSWVAMIADCTTPVDLAWLGGTVESERVTLRWWSASPLPPGVVVEIADPGGAWIALGPPVEIGSGDLEFVDATARPSGLRRYRLWSAAEGMSLGEFEVDVPAPDALALALAAGRPARGAIEIQFTLPAAAAARLEVIDVTGRRVRTLALDGRAPRGTRRIEGLPSGVYWVVLRQRAAAVSARGVVLR